MPPLTDPTELEGSTAVVVTATPAATVEKSLTDWLRGHPEVAVVDASAEGLDLGEDEAAGTRLRRYHLADPALAGPAAFVATLAPLRPCECHLTLLNPVSGFGAEALEELAAQAAARLSGVLPKKARLLPGVLAFDLVLAHGADRARMARQFARLFPDIDLQLHALDAGVFHGHASVVEVRCATAVRESSVRALFHASSAVRLARRNEIVRPSDAIDYDRALCAELACRGEWVSAWVVADGVHLGTLTGVVAAIEALTAS